MKDNLEFINTHPNLVGFLMGLLISMEEKGENRDTIKGLKVALFGPIAGIGDAIFWFTLLPIYGGNLLIICQSGKPAGADSIFRRLPAYLFPASRLDPRRVIQSA
ncbi:PTS system N-acetylgalactosamine-specific transporter subunit IID [Escherichia coli]|uniref:PTS system N-acetylgalactosamine-specific transporter subunit IID n=1 Tax=Escherichia coli TaxID=562 RepID=A0A376MIX9_ECOLX|nr:PTS system N-acetylgalactosamine-specific transporter subunit IID [Escherichia coli]